MRAPIKIFRDAVATIDDAIKTGRLTAAHCKLAGAEHPALVAEIKDRYAGLRIGPSLPGDVVILLRQCATAVDEGAIIGDLLQVHEGREETTGKLATANEMQYAVGV